MLVKVMATEEPFRIRTPHDTLRIRTRFRCVQLSMFGEFFRIFSSTLKKNVRRIINSRKGFITEKFVYERTLPLDKPFFLEKTEKGLPYVAK